jgi:hypothetical protein
MTTPGLDGLRLFRIGAISAGAALCLLLALSRLPGLYDGLWEDEVHYNILPLGAASLRALRTDVQWLMRPMLDFVLRKWVWFAPLGLAVTERNLALIPWVTATLHLLLLVLVPWTPYPLLRLIAALVLGFCSVEIAYSTEAQGYSLVSLASTLLALAFLLAARRATEGRALGALLVFEAAFAVVLNTHFFSWPFALGMVGLLGIWLARSVSSDRGRLRLLAGLAVTSGAILLATVELNEPSLLFLLKVPPHATASFEWHWGAPLGYVAQAWHWLRLPALVYLPVVAIGLAHPWRAQRHLAWGLAATVVALKYLTVGAMLGRSSYPIADRYLIMFLSPALLAFCLGLESAAARADRRRPGAGTALLAATLGIVLLHPPAGGWPAVARQAQAGVERWRSTPGNSSPPFEFFETAKSFGRPLLVLTNHCRASDVPRFYLDFLGRPPRAPSKVIDMWPDCETGSAERTSAIRAFLTDHREDGLVAFYYEVDRGRASPCRVVDRKRMIHRDDRLHCLAIVEARHVAVEELESL